MKRQLQIPNDLEEAITVFIDSLDASSKKGLKEAKEHNNIVSFGDWYTGMNFRNSWNLWGRNNLTKYFNSIGISHADDIGSMLFCCVHRRLNGRPIDVEGQVKFYQDFWKKSGYPDGIPT